MKLVASALCFGLMASNAFALSTITFGEPNGTANPETLINTVSTSDGRLTFRLNYYESDRSLGPALFNTDCSGGTCNQDADLVPDAPNAGGIDGNILILQNNDPNADGDGDLANDDPNPAPGGQSNPANLGLIFFTLTDLDSTFTGDVDFTSVSVQDDGRFEVFSVARNDPNAAVTDYANPSDLNTALTLTSVKFDTLGEKESAEITLLQSEFIRLALGDTLALGLSGSGGFDNLKFLLTPSQQTEIPLPAGMLLMLTGTAAFMAARAKATRSA